jgi:hypothetical protein
VQCCFQPLLKAWFVLLDFGFSPRSKAYFDFGEDSYRWIPGLVFEPHNQRLEVFWYMCSWGVFLNTHTRCSVKCVKGSGLLDLFDFSCPSLARAFARID